MNLNGMAIFDHAHPKIIESTFSIAELVNFRIPWPDWPHPFLTLPTQKSFDQLLIFVIVYQHEKLSPSICSFFR